MFIFGVFVCELIVIGVVVFFVNGVFEVFVFGVVLELFCGICINVVSFLVFEDVFLYYLFFFGFVLVLLYWVGMVYVKSVFGV